MRASISHLSVMALAGVAGAVAGGGCYVGNDGLEPRERVFHYPTAAVISPGGTSLYVANSDFDLQYNGGTVQLLALPRLREIVGGLAAALSAAASSAGEGAKSAETVCSEQGAVLAGLGHAGLHANPEPVLHPGPCGPVFLDATLNPATRAIGAFASGAFLAHNPTGPGARLFVTVRGDPSVTFFHVDDDRPSKPAGAAAPTTCTAAAGCLECEQTITDDDQLARCGPENRVGERANTSNRGLILPSEPVGIAGAARGDAVVIAHQAEHAASLVVNRWTDLTPTLEHFISSLPEGPTDLAAVPVPAFITRSNPPQDPADPKPDVIAYQPGFLVTFRAAAELDLLRFQDDRFAKPARPFLTRVAAIGINANSGGDDSRGIVIDPTHRLECEARCPEAPGDLACLRDCTATPLDFYVANRSPASLLVGRIHTELVQTEDEAGATVVTGAFDTMAFHDSIPLAFGASKLALGHVIDEDGVPQRRIFAAAFDSRLVFDYDPEARRIEATIRTGRGPHALAFDTGSSDGTPAGAFSFLYVTHFTDSYLGVVDLDMRRPATFGSMIATIGVPSPPPESK